MRWTTRQRFSWLFALWLPLADGVAAEADQTETVRVVCANPGLEVVAKPGDAVEEVCIAADLAVKFLSRYGMALQRPVRIRVVEHPIHNRSYSAYGSYDSRSDQVQIMSPAAMHRSVPTPTIYGQTLDEDHYRGIVAHEVAHALIRQNSRVLPLPVGVAAQEYLAHVTQLAVLSPGNRRRMIGGAGVGPWESGDVISEDYMAMSPARFAVKSYLHFQQHPEPAKFVGQLLESKWFYINVE